MCYQRAEGNAREAMTFLYHTFPALVNWNKVDQYELRVLQGDMVAVARFRASQIGVSDQVPYLLSIYVLAHFKIYFKFSLNLPLARGKFFRPCLCLFRFMCVGRPPASMADLIYRLSGSRCICSPKKYHSKCG